MKFDKIYPHWLKFSINVNDNDNIIDIRKYQHIMAVYLIIVTFSAAMRQIPRSTERILAGCAFRVGF